LNRERLSRDRRLPLPKAVRDSVFAIVWNGFADGAPAAALRDYLVDAGARVVTVVHPLLREGGKRHEITVYERRRQVHRRSVPLPLGPPASFAIDPIVPLRMPRVDAWFGFNCVACARGLVARRLGGASTVVYWCVDFVPDRFGRGPLTAAYDALDRLCCRRADARFELSDAARDGRHARHELDLAVCAPTRVVPMGAWLDRVPTTDDTSFDRRRVVFLGHLVPRQGVSLFLDALAVLRDRRVEVTASVIGGGPLEAELRAKAEELGLRGVVQFHGFVRQNSEVERLLAECSIAVAPYVPDPDSFSHWADPGKLKAYLAAGLPILVTDVPPNADELAVLAGAEIVPFDASSLASAIARSLGDVAGWREHREAALEYARAFDWSTLLGHALDSLGFSG